MKKLLLPIFLICTQLAFAQVRVSLDSQLSVTFPINPTKTKTGADSYVYSANQNGAFYIATVTDMGKQFDYTTNGDSLQHFYDNLLNSTVKKVSAKLDYKQSTTIADVKGFEFGYTLDNKGGFPDMRFQRSVYLNKTLYSFQFWTFKDKLKANTADRDVFFNTITKPREEAPAAPYQAAVKVAPADSGKTVAKQATTKPAGSPLGYYAGVIIGCLLLGAFIMVIIKLVIKTPKSPKKKK